MSATETPPEDQFSASIPPPSAPTSSPAEPIAAAPGLPDDADHLRGHYFKELLRKPVGQGAIALAAIVAGLGGSAIAGPAVGIAGFLLGGAVAVLFVFLLASSNSEDAFFAAYAEGRGMHEDSGKIRLPTATPLLRKGDKRYAVRTLDGPLGDGFAGTVALYTYEVESSGSDGSTDTSYRRFTVVLTEVAESSLHIPQLYCERKSGLRSLERLEDAFRKSERVKLESEALDRRFEIFVGKGQDPVWVRRLFSPTFIVWLSESTPKEFSFELVGGRLCCAVKNHRKSAAELDELISATTAVAARLREEAQQTS